MLEFSTEIETGAYRVPCQYQGTNFRSGSSLVLSAWNPLPGQGVPPTVRDKFALNTCSGCHLHENLDNPPMPFQHINERQPQQQSSISGFLEDDVILRLEDLCTNVLEVTCGGNGVPADQAPMTRVLPALDGRPH
jgi:hypothetical protein